MTLLASIFGTDDTPGGTRGPLDDFWYRPIGQRTQSGLAITPHMAMEVSAVFACVKVISETLAMLPLIVYRRTSPSARERAIDDPMYALIHDRPNGWQTPYDFRECLTAWAAIHGNGIARKVFDGNGVVRELIPIHPSLVRIELIPADAILARAAQLVQYNPDALVSLLDVGDSLQLRYMVKQPDGSEKAYLQDEIFHVRGLSLDGIGGVVISRHAKEAIGLARAMEAYGARYFANDATIGLALEHPGQLSPEAHARLKESFARGFTGVDNAWKPKILEEGMKLSRMVGAGKDAQLVEARADQVVEIARFYRMPLHKIQHYLHATFSNVEQLAIEFVTDTIQPWATRWEQAVTRDLLPAKELFAEFLLQALLRGDSAARAAYYKERFYAGTLSRNEIRALENENPVPGGDTYYVNSATVPLDADGNPRPAEAIREVVQGAPIQQENTPPASIPDPADEEDQRDSTTDARAFGVLLADAADRIAGAEFRALDGRWEKRGEDSARFVVWAADFYQHAHRDYALRVLHPLADAWNTVRGRPSVSAAAVADLVAMRSLRHVTDGGKGAGKQLQAWLFAAFDIEPVEALPV